MTTHWTTIVPSGPFDLAATMQCGQAFRWREADDAQRGAHFEGVIHGNLIRAQQSEDDGDSVRFTSEPDPPAAFKPILEDYLGLNHDLDAIYDELAEDPILEPLFSKYSGLRVLRQDPWECLVSFICSGNNNITRISQNVEDISRAFGRRIPSADSEPRWSFPTPASIAQAGEQPLRDLKIGYKAPYIAETAGMVADGDADLFALRESEYEDALAAVTAFKGVADKIGNCVMLFSLDKLQAFPVDVHIHRAMWNSYPEVRDLIPDPYAKPKRSLTKNQQVRLRQWSQARFGPRAGYANQYLFYEDLLEGRSG